jgi:hypothetical protein
MRLDFKCDSRHDADPSRSGYFPSGLPYDRLHAHGTDTRSIGPNEHLGRIDVSSDPRNTPSAAMPRASAAALDGRPAVDAVWDALEEASFAVVAYVTAAGEPRTSGVVYAMVDGRMLIVTAADSWKARTIRDDQLVSVTVPVRRGGLLSFLFPIPPASITFRPRTSVHPPGSVEIESLSKRLASLVPEQGRSSPHKGARCSSWASARPPVRHSTGPGSWSSSVPRTL